MGFLQNFKNQIFQISDSDFESRSLELFRYQAEHNPIYKAYLSALNTPVEKISRLEEIPFMPIDFFKNHTVKTGEWEEQAVFESSGTTGQVRSRHYIEDLTFYQQVCAQAFERFYGPLQDYAFMALLPSYLERSNSSLVAMMDYFIKESGSSYSGFYLHNYEELLHNIGQARKEGKRKILLIGVTFALLELAEEYECDLLDVIVMETGGMKGRRKEMIRAELHEVLTNRLGVPLVHAEYGMTELLSQAYSKGNGLFGVPPWMKVVLRDLNDPYCISKNLRQGGINVIDLANAHSCAFIETQDVGREYPNGTFEALGRFDNSDVRGCNLLVV
jgi:hypothetical protein